MRVGVIGGGPGGLYLAALLKASRPADHVIVAERNGPDDTFGFGVVFSDSTMRALAGSDVAVHDRLREEGAAWDAVEVRHRGERLSCGGNGFVAIGRMALLRILRRRCEELGVELRFHAEAAPADLDGCDVVVAADGVRSRTRDALAGAFAPSVSVSSLRYLWCGTAARFEALTFLFERDAEGAWLGVHAYPTGAAGGMSTFIVEVDVEAPGGERGVDAITSLFAHHLDGHPVVGGRSRWGSFRTVRCGRWNDGRVVLLGDAAHSAHFSVGSGTKMAMEDALALCAALRSGLSVEGALVAYEAARRPAVERIQEAAVPSLAWWEGFGRAAAMEPEQFAFHFLSRSRRLGRDGLAARDPAFVERVEAWFRRRHGLPAGASPLLSPLPALGLSSRLVALDGGAAGTLRLADTGRRGVLLAAPGDDGVGGAVAAARAAIAAGASVVGIAGCDLAATTVAEIVRLELGTPALLLAAGLDEDALTTLVLSGRADVVALPAAEISALPFDTAPARAYVQDP